MSKTVYIDVDNTLVFSAAECPGLIRRQLPQILINDRIFFVNTSLVEMIKDFKARGHTVIIWSAGGGQWAEMVVRKLSLFPFVEHCLSKPDWLFDDKEPVDWLPKRDYIPPPPDPSMLFQVSMRDIMDVIYKNSWGGSAFNDTKIEDELREKSNKYVDK